MLSLILAAPACSHSLALSHSYGCSGYVVLSSLWLLGIKWCWLLGCYRLAHSLLLGLLKRCGARDVALSFSLAAGSLAAGLLQWSGTLPSEVVIVFGCSRGMVLSCHLAAPGVWYSPSLWLLGLKAAGLLK